MRTTLLALTSALLLVTSACAERPDAISSSSPQESEPSSAVATPGVDRGEWTRLPESPLSPREGAVAAHVGSEVVFVGGYAGQPCPPNADCMRPGDDERDGAAYDVEAGTWRRIADAPRPVPSWAPRVAIGKQVYVLTEAALLVWDSAEDVWDGVDLPRGVRWTGLVADGARLILASGSDENGIRPDHVYDTATGQWSTLPEDPLKPSFDRFVTPTPEGLVLTAKEILPNGGPADPALVQAALLPEGAKRWRPLPQSDQLGGWTWTWTGRRLVDATLGGADGGETNNFGRVIPYGGRFDPSTEVWSRLPDAPQEGTGGWLVEAFGGPLVATGGWLYDDTAETWTRLPRPRGAPAEPGSAVWADDALLVHGGAEWGGVDTTEEWTAENVWSTATWIYRPG
jgi:hypothetical protein